MADVIPFPSRAQPRAVLADETLPPGLDFYAMIEALGPAPDGQPSGFAVIALERGSGSVTRREMARFGRAQIDEAHAVASEANTSAHSELDPRGSA
ncbi:hypothetical protein [Methylopila sp. Yamaguchi]|uniref:hypothetical protein n=1 Tax=Methylopila sp. Yamaguchi TaxID=1437817 RepID=UPI000CBCB4CB|nr:hypothetical protein [Methylopila sp. Yamaguchi]GBD48150.1 hypothetical protein METY_1363 [Methylopila sp. Yamaguchi]